MAEYLLDTHVALWAVADPDRLNAATRRIVEENRYALSVATLWEFMNKVEKTAAPLRNPAAWWEEYVVKSKTPVLPVLAAHVLYLERLPWYHRDPFDRILLAQAAVEKIPLVTADARLRDYRADIRPAVD